MKDEHGSCPHCKADLNGGSIWQTFFDKTGSEEEADNAARSYGASRTYGQWGRQAGIYDMEKDRTVRYKCPDCQGEWPR